MKKQREKKKQSISKAPKAAAETARTESQLKKMEKGSPDKASTSSKKERYETIVLSVMRSVHQSIELQEVLENAVYALKNNIEVVDHCIIFLVEGQEAVIRAHAGNPQWFINRIKRLPYPKGFTWKTIIEGKPIYCDDVDKDTAIGPAGRKVGIKSYLSIPISYNDKTIGCINLHSYKKYAFDEEDIRLLNIVTQQIEIAINHAKRAEELKALYDELNERNKGLEMLNAITTAVHKFLDIEEVYKIALDMTEVLENVDMTMIYLVDEDRKQAVLKAYKNLPQFYLKKASRIQYPKGVTWKVINSGKIINIENAQNQPDMGPAGRKLGHHGILGIPIMLGEKATGVVWFCSYKERVFDSAEVDLLTSIGDQIAIAVAKADLYKVLTKKNRYETIISSVLRGVHQSIDLQEVMDNAIDAISENINAIQHLGIYIIEGEEAVLRAYKGLPDWFYKKVSRIPYPKGFIWNTMIEGKPRYVADVDQDNVIGPAGKKFGTKSYVCVPIQSEGKTVGVLGIASLKKNAFDQDELELLEIVANQIETAMNNARQAGELKNLYKELSHKNKDLESLNTINQAVHKFHDLEKVYKTALDMTKLMENVDVASIYLVDEQKKEAVLQGQRNLPKEYVRRASRIPYRKGATWKVINSGEIINIEDAQNHTDIGPAGSKLGHHGVLGVPIKVEEQAIGVIWFGSYKKRKYDEHEVELLSSIGYQIATAIAKAKLYRELLVKNRYETIVSSILRSIYQSIDLQEVLENAVESLTENVDRLDIAAIYLVEGKEAVLKAHRGYTKKFIKRAGRIPYPKGATWKAIIDDKCRYVPDVAKDKYLGPAGREHGMKCYLSVPIRSHGKAVGTLNMVSFQVDAFDMEEITLLETVAQQIDIAINNAQQAEALRQSEERYRILFDQSPVGVFISDNELRITQCNTRLVEILESTYEKIIGLDMRKLKDKSFVPAMKKAIEGESTYYESYYEATSSSAKLWLSLYYSPLLDGNGLVIGGIGIVQDITQRKQAEIELEDQKSGLLTTFNSLGNAVIATNSTGTVTFMNSLAESLTGRKNTEVINKNLAGVLKLKDRDSKKLIRIPRQIPFNAEDDLSLPSRAILIGRDREETPVDIGISNLRDEVGNIRGNVFLLRETSGDGLVLPESVYTESSEAYPPGRTVSLMIGVSSIFVVEGVSRILESAPSIDLVARTSEQKDIIPLLLESRPDVLFFDTALLSPGVEEILDSIKEHKLNTKLLLLIQDRDERSIIDAVALGVRGCITEPSNSAQLIQAIRAVGNDEIWIGVGLVTKILTRLIPKEKDEPKLIKTGLTKKEEEIVELVVEGMGNKQISSKLFISEITVKTHLRNIFKKLGIRSRYEIVKKFGS